MNTRLNLLLILIAGLAVIFLGRIFFSPPPPLPTRVALTFPQAPLLLVGSAEVAGCAGAPPSVTTTATINATVTPATAPAPAVNYVAAPGSFAVVGTLVPTLGATNTVRVRFTPTITGPRSGTLTVNLPNIRIITGRSSLNLLGLGTCLGIDTDGDGISDRVEDANGNGVVDPGETNPGNPDTDGDGIIDGFEDANKNGVRDAGESDPRNADSDGDMLPDGIEDSNKNGRRDGNETDVNNADTDGDLIPDGVEDANRDGRRDRNETDPRRADTDRDEFDDGVEDANRNGRVDPGETDPLDRNDF